MELKEITRKEEPLLSRMKAEFEVEFDKATPDKNEVRKGLAKKLGKEEKLIEVQGVYNIYGRKKAKVVCYAYNDEETGKKLKAEGRKAKEKAQKKAGEQQKEAPKEEKTQANEEAKEGQ